MRIFRLLSFRLFAFIAALLAILVGLASYFQLNFQSQNYLQMVTEYGRRTSELIQGSTKHSMLLNNKEETHYIIRSLAEQSHIETIRIYNKRGVIIFSSNPVEIDQIVDMENEACFMCHNQSDSPIKEPSTQERRRIFKKADGSRLMGFVTAIKNEESCYNAVCHYHDAEEPLLGTLDVILSLKTTDRILAEEKRRLISSGVAIILVLALSVGIFIWVFVHVPVRKLIMGTMAISSGDLDYRIEPTSKDEIGQLACSFNSMAEKLIVAKQEITAWSNELEKRVQQKTDQLKKTQERIMQIEKMASLGQLSATVAHELNNPIAGILTYSKLIQKKLRKGSFSEAEKKSVLEYLKMIETESERSGQIVKNLLLFARKQEPEFKRHDLNQVVEASLQLVSHHLELNQISLHKSLAKNIPPIFVDENQLKQALLALYVNAVEAMEHGGILTVKTQFDPSGRKVLIVVQDNGRGIPEGDIEHIFEPFFTTKSAVKGVGLGLSVVYGIIRNHQG